MSSFGEILEKGYFVKMDELGENEVL